jgi:hypothetical protein
MYSKMESVIQQLLARSAAVFRTSFARGAVSSWRAVVAESRRAAAEARRKRALADRVLRRMTQQRLFSSFNAWAQAAAEAKRQRAVCRRSVLRMLNAKLGAGFSAWLSSARAATLALAEAARVAAEASHAAELARVREEMSRLLDASRGEADAALRAQLAGAEAAAEALRAAAAAAAAAAEKDRRDAVCRRVVLRALNTKLFAGLVAWRSSVAELVRRERVMGKALRMMRNRAAAKAFARR